MSNMLAAKRNRGVLGVDDPWDDDGFWAYRRFKGNRRGGSPTGGRAWRRSIRAKESRRVRDEVRSELD